MSAYVAREGGGYISQVSGLRIRAFLRNIIYIYKTGRCAMGRRRLKLINSISEVNWKVRSRDVEKEAKCGKMEIELLPCRLMHPPSLSPYLLFPPPFVPVLCPATVEIERDHASRMLLNIRGSLLQDFPATVFNLADVRGGCEERWEGEKSNGSA